MIGWKPHIDMVLMVSYLSKFKCTCSPMLLGAEGKAVFDGEWKCVKV